MAATSRCMSVWAEACSASATIKAVRVCSRTAEWLLCRFVHRRACALPAPPASRSHDRLAAQGSGTRPRPREPTRQQRSCRIARACARDNPGLAPFSACTHGRLRPRSDRVGPVTPRLRRCRSAPVPPSLP
jgi:hypothetical protein